MLFLTKRERIPVFLWDSLQRLLGLHLKMEMKIVFM